MAGFRLRSRGMLLQDKYAEKVAVSRGGWRGGEGLSGSLALGGSPGDSLASVNRATPLPDTPPPHACALAWAQVEKMRLCAEMLPRDEAVQQAAKAVCQALEARGWGWCVVWVGGWVWGCVHWDGGREGGCAWGGREVHGEWAGAGDAPDGAADGARIAIT